MCGVKTLSSLSKPSGSRASSTSPARVRRLVTPSPTPAHRTRAFSADGKAPKPSASISKVSCLAATSRRTPPISVKDSSGTSPRNFKVKWTFSGFVQRTSPFTFRFRAVRSNSFRASRGGKMATKVRTVSLFGFTVLAAGGAVGDQGCRRPGADPVVHVDDREAGGATLEHPEDGGRPVPAEPVPS